MEGNGQPGTVGGDKARVLSLYEALGKGDDTAIGRLISRAAQALVVGTDPAEWFVGHSEITETLKAQMEEMGGGFPFQAGTFRPIAKVASAGLRTRRP